jgi:hypothetical protein
VRAIRVSANPCHFWARNAPQRTTPRRASDLRSIIRPCI